MYRKISRDANMILRSLRKSPEKAKTWRLAISLNMIIYQYCQMHKVPQSFYILKTYQLHELIELLLLTVFTVRIYLLCLLTILTNYKLFYSLYLLSILTECTYRLHLPTVQIHCTLLPMNTLHTAYCTYFIY